MLGMFAFNTQAVIGGAIAQNVQGMEGSVLQMVNHGITIGALFLIAGFLEERTGTRRLGEFGTLARRVPILATVMLIAVLSSLGLPGLNSFAGEFLALLGAFRNNVIFGTLGTIVVIPAAWYLIRFFQEVMEGSRQAGRAVTVAERRGMLSGITDHWFGARAQGVCHQRWRPNNLGRQKTRERRAKAGVLIVGWLCC